MEPSLERSAGEWVLRNPRGEESVFSLTPGETVTVGRDLSVEVPILDAGVSRHHAALVAYACGQVM